MAVTGIDKKIITQVCIIVEDVAKSADAYRKVFGWEIPDMYQITRFSDHTQAKYYGESTDARALISGFNIGDIQFELLQPLGPPSAWQDYLDQHGEGIHHIAFFVPKTEPAAQSFIEHGYQITQEGLFTRQTGKYTYLDTDKDLAVVIELLEHFNGSPAPKGPDFSEDAGIGTDVVCQVGIIVNDIEATSQRVSDILGLPKPPTLQTPGYDIVKTTYKGEPSEATAKLAFFNTGQVQIELIEPDEKPSVWRDYLEAKGEGAQHIAFRINDTKRVTDYLAQHGIEISQQGFYADGSGMYTYMDSDALLGTTIELLENF
jgi:catechol 2,3-dioxygenase-like lactoylglutathione lyase family enzyme